VNLPSILGTIGTGVGLIRAVPQLARLLRAREAFGVSADTAATSSIVSFGWATYGYVTDHLSILVYAVFQLTTSGLIVFFKLEHGKRLGVKSLAPFSGGTLG
jgi:uncharacterized protein with PQ loop repeat